MCNSTTLQSGQTSVTLHMKTPAILFCLLFIAAPSHAQTISLVNTGLVGNMRPPINEEGQVAYQNNVGGVTTATYLGKPGVPIQMVVATNGPIAGSPPYTFSSLTGRPIANGTNQVAFYEGGFGGFGGGGGLFANLNGTLYRVAVRSNQVPGLAAGILYLTGSGSSTDTLPVGYSMNSSGVFAFNSELTGPGLGVTNNRVVMKGHPTNLTIIARSGSAAPGFPAGWVFQGDDVGGGINGQTYINGSNRLVFIAAANHPSNTSVSTNCIWFHDAQGLRRVVVFDSNFPTTGGTPAPDAGTGAQFNQLWFVRCHLNDAGEIAFYALAATPSFTLTTGIWSGPTNNLHLVIYHDMAAPGIGGGVTISSLDFNRFYLGNTGAVAVVANLAGTGVVTSNNTALYLGSRTNNLQLIARKGMAAPGCPAGVYFSALNNSTVSDPVIFGNNRVAFGGILAGTGVTSGNNLGLWATDTNGVLQLVFRTGDTLLEMQPGVFRTINTFFYAAGTGQNGRASSINRKGQLSMDVTVNGAPNVDGIYVLDLNSAGSVGGGTSSFGSWQYLPGTGFQLNLNLQAGKPYRLQRTLSLTPTNWVTLTNFTSTGTSASYLDTVIGFPLGIYQVISP